MTPRSAGILLHPTSLPGPYGIGDLGPETGRFLYWMAAAGQSICQVLPLGPTAFSHSPYVSLSAFAGNPLLISPERLVEEGLLASSAIQAAPAFPADRVDFEAASLWRETLLRSSWDTFRRRGSEPDRRGHREFLEAPEQADWLSTWALFAALKGRQGGADWRSWDPEIRRRDAGALARARADLEEEVEYQGYLQFLFFRQWERVRREAHARGISIFGDAPIYVALDSADVWEGARYFQLDDRLEPTAVSGVPPDYFSDTGQLWGTPLYRWDRLEADGFGWWIRRIRGELRKLDLLRLDHFRAFQAYWSVPAGSETARGGHWEPGPGIRLFRALEAALGALPLVAEDLGDITEDVRELRDALGFPGMRVLQFGLGHPKSEHHPSRIPRNAVAYTGTHDNDTARGWFGSLAPEERARVLADLGSKGSEIHWDMIRSLYATPAERVIVPIQDVLGLGSEARMNVPAEPAGNWLFRLRPGSLVGASAERLRQTACAGGSVGAK